MSTNLNIAVIHPDLGIGGAERLIVDAAKALGDCGHQVTIYTGYHDKRRCFDETRDGTLKTIALVSACIPFIKLKFWSRSKVIFYCHFPDQLLTKRESLLKSIYRKPLDFFEEWSTGLADSILVNSKFTRNVVQQTFKSLRGRELIVLYPCVDINYFTRNRPSPEDCESIYETNDKLRRDQFIYLSLNRFERKKALAVAIEALSTCLFRLEHEPEVLELNKTGNKKNGLHLIVAGGYDSRLEDSVDYYSELRQLTQELELDRHVTFVESPSDEDKLRLLEICDAVVYTPENEHFGIVPLEAMAMARPVVASASGGPLETIEDGVNGFLCDRDSDNSFPNAMLELYGDQVKSRAIGSRGLARVREKFSFEAFRDNLNRVCLS